jgi:hypothetical protein
MEAVHSEFVSFLTEPPRKSTKHSSGVRVASDLQKLLFLMETTMGVRPVSSMLDGHCIELRRPLGSDDPTLTETCLIQLHSTWPLNKTWAVDDSAALASYVTECFQKDIRLVVVVIPGKVSVKARNAGFDARQPMRVVPLTTQELRSFDASPAARRLAPALVDETRIMETLLLKKRDSLLDLPLFLVTDPAILWDLDLVIGSFVHCPPEFHSFRVVAPSLEKTEEA